MQRTCCSLYTRAARWAAAAYDCMPMCIGSFSYTRSRLASLARFLFVGQSDVRLRSLLQGTRVTYVTETFPEKGTRHCVLYFPKSTSRGFSSKLPQKGIVHFLITNKTNSEWFKSSLNNTENVLKNHLLIVITMSYPCHYTNSCPRKPHKHMHAHTHARTHTHMFVSVNCGDFS